MNITFPERVIVENIIPRNMIINRGYLWMIFSTITLSRKVIFIFIIPHVNSQYKTSIDERLIFYNISRCYSNGEYCHVFAIAAGDIIKYQGGHMMRNADARTVGSRQETFNSNSGHDA